MVRITKVSVLENYRPHFHAGYSGEVALIDIRNVSVFSGPLPPRVKGFVIEQAMIHQQELMDDWERAQARRYLLNIAPLT